MTKLRTKPPAKPLLSRLQRAEGAFRIAYLEHTAWGQKMVLARTELLEANAEERAKLALQYPDDKLIQSESAKATDELLAWYKKLGTIAPTEKHCAYCGKLMNEVETRNVDVTICLSCEEMREENLNGSSDD